MLYPTVSFGAIWQRQQRKTAGFRRDDGDHGDDDVDDDDDALTPQVPTI